jgi:hypothetical protein
VRLRRDTSGSAQAVTVLDDKLVVGRHFYEVADAGGDRCGAGRPGDVDQNGDPTLDPNWDPAYSGSYSLVWELHVEGLRLHTGGELKKVSGVVQNAYARLSPASI